MANKILLRRGLKSKLPTLSAGEPAYTTDSREFFMGTGSGNVKSMVYGYCYERHQYIKHIFVYFLPIG